MSLKRNLVIGAAVGLAVIGYREYQGRYAPWLNTESARTTYREAGVVPADNGGALRGADLERFCRCTVETSADAITMAEGKALVAAGEPPPSLTAKLHAAVQGCLAKVRGR